MIPAQLSLIEYRAGDPCPVEILDRARAILRPLVPALEQDDRIDPDDARAVLADLYTLLGA